MEKIVTSGMRDCTVNLDGECAVKFGADYRVFSVQNNSDSDVIVSIYEGKTAEDDGVRVVKAGESGMLAHMRSDVDTVYVTGSGSVAIAAGNEAVNPFSKGGKGGESGGGWITAEGNPITMTGLQGGVPFNSVTVSGDDIIRQEMTLTVTGKNVIQYPYYEGSSKSEYNVDFVVDNEGKIKVSGQLRGNSYAVYYIKPRNTWYNLPIGKYTVVGGKSATRLIQLNGSRADGSAYTLAKDTGNGADFEITDKRGVGINLFIMDNEPVNEIFEPMIIYRGCDKKYEKYNGQTEYTITPDANPYVVSIDITQIDGTNVITADNDAVISVNANRKNPQLAKIYEKINDELAAQTEMIMSLSAELESRLDGGA